MLREMVSKVKFEEEFVSNAHLETLLDATDFSDLK